MPIPPDTRSAGDSGHITDHNNIADVLTALTASDAAKLAAANNLSDVASRQAAIDALTGTQGAGKVLRSDGTHATLASLQAGDVPTLNQNTSGTAAGLSATLAVGSGGTGATTASAARDSLGAFGIVNAKTDFGAFGDFSHDDTTALQNFFTAIATGGSKAGLKGYIPPGTYKITSALVGGTHTQCTGGGKYNTTIKQVSNNQDILQFAGSSGANMLGVELSDFSLTGPYRVDKTGTSTTNTSTTVGDTNAVAADAGLSISGTGIPGGTTISSVTPGTGYVISAAATATGTPNLTIGGTSTGVGLNLNYWLDTCSAKRMIIQGNGSHGVLLQNSYLVSFEHVWHYGNGGDGLHAATSLNAVKWDNCEFFGNAGAGADLNGLAGSIITASDFESNGQHGLKLTNAYSVTVEANDFENNGASSPGATYAGCYVASNSVYSGPRIVGNNFTGTAATTANGIEIAAAVTGCYLEGNSFNSFALNDILIDSGATGVVIAPNNVHVSGSGAFITDSGTGTAYLGETQLPFAAADGNYKAWNGDPLLSPFSITMTNWTAGKVFLARVQVRHAISVSKIGVYWVLPAGSPANCFLGLYNSSGTLIGKTADLSSTASGLITPSLLSGPFVLPAGYYYVAALIGTQGSSNGGCGFLNGAATAISTSFEAMNGLAQAGYRWAGQGSGLSLLPSPTITLASNALSSLPFWATLI